MVSWADLFLEHWNEFKLRIMCKAVNNILENNAYVQGNCLQSILDHIWFCLENISNN